MPSKSSTKQQLEKEMRFVTKQIMLYNITVGWLEMTTFIIIFLLFAFHNVWEALVCYSGAISLCFLFCHTLTEIVGKTKY